MLYSLIAAFLAILFVIIAFITRSELFYAYGLILVVYMFIGALILDGAIFFSKIPALYCFIATLSALLLLLSVAEFASTSFFSSEFYGLFLSLPILVLVSSFAALCYKLIKVLIELLLKLLY